MKKMKKLLVLMTCAFVLFGTAACSGRDNADNGADQSATENSATDNDRTDNNTDTNDRTMNDATEGDGILDDAVHDVTDGVDDVTDDVTDGVDKAADERTDDNGAQKDTQNNRYKRIISRPGGEPPENMDSCRGAGISRSPAAACMSVGRL